MPGKNGTQYTPHPASPKAINLEETLDFIRGGQVDYMNCKAQIQSF